MFTIQVVCVFVGSSEYLLIYDKAAWKMNLLSKLHKNSILTGPIESFCLACGCLLRSEEESYAHIHLPHHVDKLQALPQLDGYKDDCIIKIKEGYFCPYCNLILPTIKRISLHVVETKHKENKIAQSITRHGDTIFLFDIVVIDPRSWQGVDGTTCSVCNEDYTDEKEHITEPGHALNLIQARCEFGENYVYRNVDEDLFFCLICKNILPITDQESHSDSKIHQENYEKAFTEGAAIKSKKTSELNNNIALVKKDNNLPQVKPKDSYTNIKPMKDSKNTDNINLTKQVTKNDIGCPLVVDDNKATVKIDSQGLNPNKININTEKPHTQVPEADPTNKTQETAKVSTQITDTLKQEAPKIAPPEVIQEAKIESKSNKDTSNGKINNQNKDTPNKNTQDINKVQESKDTNEKAQEATNNIEAQTKELKDAVNPTPEVSTEPVKPAPVKSDKNGIAKDPDSAEPYLYKYLKSLNYVIRMINGEAFCILCDFPVDVVDPELHCVDIHHCILYQKHIDRKKKLFEKSKQDTTNIMIEKNSTVVIDKENPVPATEETKVQKTASKIDKPVEASTKNVGKEANVVDVSTDKNNQVVQKENVAPENKFGNEQISVMQSTPETKNVPLRVKSSKKAQKKAAKARAGLQREIVLDEDIKNKTKDSRDPVLDDICVSVNKKPIKITETSATVNEKATETNTTSVTVNGKVSKSNETIATVNEKASKTNETSVNKNEKASKPPENTRSNDAQKGNGTTNGAIPDVIVKTEKLLTFIKTISQVDSSPADVVINSKYVVGNLSFMLLVRAGDKVECVACNEKITLDVPKHIATEEHRIKFEDCGVVTSLNDEFIRQVKTDGYHCGFCNLSLPDWEETLAHLETYRHSDAKTSTYWRLERYLSHMKHCEKKEVRSVLTAVFRRTME